MTELATFKSPSKIQFSVVARKPDAKPRLSETKRGETFLWAGAHGLNAPAICMRTTVSAYQYVQEQPTRHHAILNRAAEYGIWIVNLQTGRTFVAIDCDIEYVKVRMEVEGVA